MLYKKTLLATSFVATLSACGGSSSPQTTTIPTPEPEPQFKQLSASVMNTDKCGNETPNNSAIMLIHNEDFTTKATVIPDEQGNFVYHSSNDTEHVSIVYQSPPNQLGQSTTLIQTYNAHPVTEIAPIRLPTADDSQCECQTNTLAVTSDARIDNSAQLLSGGFTAIEGFSASNIIDTLLCKKIDEPWPLTSLATVYINPAEAYAGWFEQIAPDTESLSVNTPGMIIDIASNMDNAGYGMVTYIDGKPHLSHAEQSSNLVDGVTLPIFQFPSDKADYYQAVGFYSQFNTAPELNGYISVQTLLSTLNTSEVGQPVTLEMPTADISLEQLMGNVSPDYDYSSINGVDQVRWQVTLIGESGGLLYWTYNGPASGSIPDFNNIDIPTVADKAAFASQTTLIHFYLELNIYPGIDGYQALMSKLAGRGNADMTTPQWQKHARIANYVQSLDFSQTAWPYAALGAQRR